MSENLFMSAAFTGIYPNQENILHPKKGKINIYILSSEFYKIELKIRIK